MPVRDVVAWCCSIGVTNTVGDWDMTGGVEGLGGNRQVSAYVKS